MNKDLNYTEFAPAEREAIENIQDKYLELINLPQVKKITDSIPDMLLILNDKRQIVFANQRLFELFQTNSVDDILGLRPGELLNCSHSNTNPGGCGTTLSCSKCGAVNAIQKSLEGYTSVEECRIIDFDNNAYDLKVWATPYEHEGNQYSIFAIQDISGVKRRDALERIFFHDIINTAGGLLGISQVIKENPEEIIEFKDILYDVANALMDEIQSQKMLMQAEKGTLETSEMVVNSLELINSVKNVYLNHIVAQGKNIVIDANSINISFITDYPLLKRTLGNLTKNALEAIREGQTVTIGVKQENENVIFWTHNSTVMPIDVQLQLFQRSFSTKGSERGLGTYSVKLLTENYLKGKVYFKSNEEDGTIFYIELPFKKIDNTE